MIQAEPYLKIKVNKKKEQKNICGKWKDIELPKIILGINKVIVKRLLFEQIDMKKKINKQ